MAPKIAYDPSSDSLLHPAQNTVFFQGWAPEDLTRNDHGLLCAEMARLAYASPDVIRQALSCIGFTLIGLIGGEGLQERLELAGTQAFVAHHTGLDLTVLAFRGTESGKPEDLFLDGNTLQRKRPGSDGCFVHRGFADAWDCVREPVIRLLDERRRTLLVTGHSLGAAIATLAAIDTEPDALITFGCPLVGNDKLATLLSSRTAVRRYVNCCDLIARIPPEAIDHEHLRQLLAELSEGEGSDLFQGLSALRVPEVVTRAGDFLRRTFHLDPHFKHIGPAIYADRTGTLRPGLSDGERRQDQKDARQAYRRTASSAPLRDLADHAPINYVSIFTGRL